MSFRILLHVKIVFPRLCFQKKVFVPVRNEKLCFAICSQ